MNPVIRSPKLEPLTTIPDARPRFFDANHAAISPITGTFAPPLPMPVNVLAINAVIKFGAIPVRKRDKDIMIIDPLITKRGPKRDARIPQVRARTRYPIIFPVARSPAWTSDK